ncbi:hypothetical protein [Ralstonia pseudosolanacearum]|uniref:hypothetical protein n=1 Tax=Ralstonia pseudosolanacearum TaxID=1310165 RepID=UPI001FFA22E1|nr:hypothetical protein [Ralstonia pseudosolanacearum]
MKKSGRIKGGLLYWVAVAAAFGVHAYGLHLDQEAQTELRTIVPPNAAQAESLEQPQLRKVAA